MGRVPRRKLRLSCRNTRDHRGSQGESPAFFSRLPSAKSPDTAPPPCYPACIALRHARRGSTPPLARRRPTRTAEDRSMLWAYQQLLDPLQNDVPWSAVWSTLLAALPVVVLFWLLVP